MATHPDARPLLADGKPLGADRSDKERRHLLEGFLSPFRVEPGSAVRMPKDFPTDITQTVLTKQDGQWLLQTGTRMLSDLQAKLAAQDRYGLLVVLQAMDAAGKDGTIRHVMSGVNPQGVRVESFKIPSAEELNHDYLWRYARRLPARGEIGIFNRSHYEELLVVRVHPELLQRQHLPEDLAGKGIWKRRFRAVNDWERYLTDNGIRVVKIFLHVSQQEQARRLLKRIDDPARNWKFSPSDMHERDSWKAYMDAYSEVLSHTSTSWAPWYALPADTKWFARVGAAAVIVQSLLDIHPGYPKAAPEVIDELPRFREELSATA
ncbi:MAG: polyphosphate kinase 2 family protein [Candidatus Nanopelagicales bacterium]